MLDFILGVLCAALAVVSWVLLRTYRHVPRHELKRLARQDAVAALLYRAAAYGASLKVLLGSAVTVFGVLALAAFSAIIGLWLAVILLAVLIGVGWLVLVPGDELTSSSLWLARKLAPGIAWLLERLAPAIDAGVRFVRGRHGVRVHTGVYEKSDLVELLERQKGQPDSRILESEIELLQHALTFGDRLVTDALVPMRVVKMVAAGETIGPVLMDELSRSGHSRFPVYEGSAAHIVGVLYLHDLVSAKHGGTVADVMSRKLTYVHEDFTLYQALQAFLKTKRHLFLVVNSFEELVGILTIEDVLEQMIGKPIMDEFDKYDDLRAVAAAAAKKEHAEHQKAKAEPDGPANSPRRQNSDPSTDGESIAV
ncbi:MAG TPA: CBS domain-containing protein [Candidatus Saccharimonadales bacterium]|jgi:CBS domain containing-hemolysin-like protein